VFGGDGNYADNIKAIRGAAMRGRAAAA